MTGQPYGMQVRGTSIYVNGQRLRHIGMNHFPLFMRELYDFQILNKGLEVDLAEMKAAGFRFIRTAFGFFDYASWRDLYYNNQATYWATADRVLNACAAAGMGVMVNMGWWGRGFSPLTYNAYGASVGPRGFGEPSSTLWTLWRDYVTTFVRRYANHPAVWAWQLFNEVSGNVGPEWNPGWKVDGTGTDQGGTPLPGDAFDFKLEGGARPEGGAYQPTDKLSQEGWGRFTAELVRIVAANDPHNRIVTSGSGLGMAFAVRSRVNNSLGADSLSHWTGGPLTEFQPWPAWRERNFPVVCAHLYMRGAKQGDGQFWGDGDCPNYQTMIQYHKQWADQVGKPFILEEWGACWRSPVDGVSTDAASEEVNFRAGLQGIVDNNVDVSLVWGWSGQRPNGMLTEDNGDPITEWKRADLTAPERLHLLQIIIDTNRTRF